MPKKKYEVPHGRQTDYIEDLFPEQAYWLLCETKLSNAKLAEFFGVTDRTLYKWMNKHPEFKEAIQAGRDRFSCDVAEHSLMKRVKGFRYTETTYEPSPTEKDKNGNPKMVPVKRVSKAVVPSVRASITWLERRDRERWKPPKNETSVEGPLTVEVVKFDKDGAFIPAKQTERTKGEDSE